MLLHLLQMLGTSGVSPGGAWLRRDPVGQLFKSVPGQFLRGAFSGAPPSDLRTNATRKAMRQIGPSLNRRHGIEEL